MKNLTIRVVKTEPELAAMLYQRWLVLRKPLGMPRGTESDRYDGNALHVIAVNLDPAVSASQSLLQPVIGSARLRELSPGVGSIAYVAVLPGFQHQGIGSALIQHLIELAKEQSFSQLRVMARASVIRFYQRFGFVARAETVNYLGTPHRFMDLSLNG
jgi:ribosomal protein S18 acetylase RimI-like enzyme